MKKKSKTKSDPFSRIPSNPYSFAVGDVVFSKALADFFSILEIDFHDGVPEGAVVVPLRGSQLQHWELLADLVYVRTPERVPKFVKGDRVASVSFPDDVFTVFSCGPFRNGFIVTVISDERIYRFILEDDLVPAPTPPLSPQFKAGDRVTVVDGCGLCDPDEVFVISSIESSFGESYAFLKAASGLTHAEDFENLYLVTKPPVAPPPAVFKSSFDIGDHVLIDGCTEIVYFVDSVANHPDGSQVVFLDGPGHCAAFDVDPARLSVATISVASATIPDDPTTPTPTQDNVNHPSHYTSDPSGVECWQVTRHRSFNVGNAFKYLWRAGLKEDANLTSASPSAKHVEDLYKAVAYINDEIALLDGVYR